MCILHSYANLFYAVQALSQCSFTRSYLIMSVKNVHHMNMHIQIFILYYALNANM